MTTTTASSTPTKDSLPWQSLRKEAHADIMNTDILCEIAFLPGQEGEAAASLETAFAMMRDFENRYSRFKKDNELWNFNHSTQLQVSPEFFHILERAVYFYEQTSGLFDPSILPSLEQEGYPGAADTLPTGNKRSLREMTFDVATLTVSKPIDLRIDLGGIGKGYIVDAVATFLSEHFENFLVDAGGDIAVRGGNRTEGYTSWGIDVEHPKNTSDSVALLLLSDMAVATSGRNRRHWIKNGESKHHLIDPATGKSATSDLLSVTVIAPSATMADVFAKTLFIAGREKGLALAEKLSLPALFVESSGAPFINSLAQKYVWHA